MGRADYRGGRAPIRTASELALLLPVPLLMVVEGYATVLFPDTDRSNMSPAVVIVPVRPKFTYPPPVGFPVYVHWKQWNDVIVPLLEGEQLSGWRGIQWQLGQAVTLMNAIVGPGGVVVYPEGFLLGLSAPGGLSLGRLYACDPFDSDRVGGKLGAYLNAASGLILQAATEAGY